MLRLQKLAALSFIMAALLLTIGCGEEATPPPSEPAQGVKGIVTVTPGYDGELVENQLNQPDLTPKPLAGASVYLINRDGPGGIPVFVDSTLTDSTGRYTLSGMPGQYYLGAGRKDLMAAVLVALPGDTTEQQRRIQTLVGLNLLPGVFIDQPLNINELSVQ